MLERTFGIKTDIDRTRTPLEFIRQRYMLISIGVLVVMGVITTFSATGLTDDRSFNVTLLVEGLFWLASALVLGGLIRFEYETIARYTLIGVFVASMFFSTFIDIQFTGAILGTVLAALLLPRELPYYGVLVGVGITYVIQYLEWRDQYIVPGIADRPISPISIGILIIVAGLIMRRFVRTAERVANDAQRTTNLLATTAEVGQITTTVLEIKSLFTQAVELIRERFGYYHVQVFVIDENREYAELVASTGVAGRNLLSKGHKLAVGSRSVIGRVTLTGEIIIARDTDRDTRHAHNELLPNTRAEMALPIMDGTEIIGALDVQSVHANAFTEIDVRALEVLAGQLATAVRNARLFEAETARTEENKRLYITSERNLQEIERLNKQLTGDAWESYLNTQGDIGGITFDGENISYDAPWTDNMIQAGKRARPYMPRETPGTLAVPLTLRGEVIGVIEIELGEGLRSSDAFDTVQTIAQRLALSLDRARLYQEAQVTSHRQRHINEIVARYQAAPTVEDLLQITVSELSQSLDASRASIRLSGGMDEPNGANGSNDHNGTNGHNGGNGS